MKADLPSSRGDRRLAERPLLQNHPVALRVAMGLWIGAGLLFLAIAIPSLRDIVQVVDDAVHRWVVTAEWRPLVVAAQVLDFIGTAWVAWPLMIAVAGWLAWVRRWEAFSSWMLTLFVSQLMIGPIKDIYERPRPSMSLADTSSWSFPSGHSVAGAAMAVAAVIVLVPAGPKRRNLEMAAAAFAIVMALSRVYLRAHWLSDVAAGAALGAAIAIGAAALMHRIDDRRRRDDDQSHVQ